MKSPLRSLLLSVLVATLATGCPRFPEDTPEPDAGTSPDLGPPVARTCSETITFDGAPSADSVTVAGEFNDWDITADPMQRRDGLWTLEVEADPGAYGYKFVIDGAYEQDVPPDVYTKWVGGEENRLLRIENCRVPKWTAIEHEVGEDGSISVVFRFERAADNTPLDPQTIDATVGGVSEGVDVDVDEATGTVRVGYRAEEYGKYSVRISGADADGVPAQNNPMWLPLWYEEEPWQWQDATMYLIFNDRFADSDGTSPYPPIDGVAPIANYMGGDFRGITERIESGYLDEMGVNLLWLSPIYENTDGGYLGGDGVTRYTGYHGYWPVRSLTSESRYGDMDADSDTRLRELIDAAHARGIRVLFDVVFNHVHEDHRYCNEQSGWCDVTCTCGAPNCGWDDRPIICQFAPYLPDLNYKNHAIVDRLLDDTMRLAEKFDVDGFRVDAAKHMNHVIMRSLRLRLEELEAQGAAEFYTVGETYTFTGGHGLIMNYVADYELHGQFDFPLVWTLRETFKGGGSFRALEDAVATSQRVYGSFYHWMSPFLGNHDIPRFVTDNIGNARGPFDNTPDLMAQGPPDQVTEWEIINRTSMAFAFLLTQPGIPLIYYGDEIGLAGAGDPDNRRMMIWEHNANQRELLDRVRELGTTRQEIDALRYGDRRELWVDDDFYVYARDNGNGDVAIVAMNKGDATRTVEVTIPNALELEGATLPSALSSRELRINGGSTQVTLDSWEYAIYAAP